MLCEYCGVREAEVEFLDVSSRGIRRHHLCKVCAAKLAINPELLDIEGYPQFQAYGGNYALERCSRCALSFEEYRETGKFGCANCYFSFWEAILPEIEKFNGSKDYRGKAYHRDSNRFALFDKYVALQRRLKIAAAEEEFELAADIKRQLDKIKRILTYEISR